MAMIRNQESKPRKGHAAACPLGRVVVVVPERVDVTAAHVGTNGGRVIDGWRADVGVRPYTKRRERDVSEQTLCGTRIAGMQQRATAIDHEHTVFSRPCTHSVHSATIPRTQHMETLVIAFAILTAAAATIIAVVVLIKVVQPSRGSRPTIRPGSTAGFPWLVLGIVGTVVFGLLDLSVLLPLLVALGGLIAVVVGVYRQWKRGS